MAGKITDLTSIGAVDRSADLLEIVDISAGSSNKVTPNNLIGISGGSVLSTTDTQAVDNKTISNTNTIAIKDSLFTLQDNSDITKQAQFQLSSITTATTRTYTLPDASSTLMDLSTAQTATNKTLTNPVITLPTIADFSHAQHDHSSPEEGGLIAGGAGGNILLQTNSSDNDSQIKLNLTAGTNVTITDNGAGAIEIAASGGGGGGGVLTSVDITSSGAVDTTTSAIPYDDTIPQSSEGKAISAFAGFSFTGEAAETVMIVELDLMVSSSATTDTIIGTIFVDASADAIGVGAVSTTTAGQMVHLHVVGYTPIGTNTYTFSFRYGTSNSGTITLNGVAGARKFGALNPKSVATFWKGTMVID